MSLVFKTINLRMLIGDLCLSSISTDIIGGAWAVTQDMTVSVCAKKITGDVKTSDIPVCRFCTGRAQVTAVWVRDPPGLLDSAK